jgi:hypothetical protein
MNDEFKHSRRNFVKGGLIAAGSALPVAALCDAIFKSVVRDAFADAAGASSAPRNYINVAALAAPCRYAFDQWVRVNDSDAALAPNPMVSTRLAASGGVYTDSSYEVFKVSNSTSGGILVPSFFKGSVTTSAGNQPLTDLLQNMLVIRGFGTNIDGHPGNHQNQLMPINGAPSISGAVADVSSLIFPAVQYPARSGYTTFSSATAKGMATVGDPALQSLMTAFGPTNATRVADIKAAHANTINYYEARLKALTQSSDASAQGLALNVENARKLMKRGISDIQNYWGPAVQKYTSVVQGALRANGIYGVSDLPITNTQGTSNFGFTRDNLFHFQTADNADGFYVMAPNLDMRQTLAQATTYYFAEGLALAEYLITQQLGGVLEIQLPYLYSIDATVFSTPAQTATKTLTATYISHDMHTTGGVSTVLYTNALFRAFSAGVLELSNKLKSMTSANGGNVWQDTVVHLTGDFGRVPRSDGTGSDHGFNQMVQSVYSGLITAPMVVGNVMAGGIYSGYDGSQGLGAPIDSYSQAGRPTPIMAASTLAEMLRLPANPYHNLAAPLVQVVNGQLAYASFGQGKTVG